MDWLKSVTDTINIIENNLLNKDLDISFVAKKLFVDSVNLQKAFSILTGVSMGEYIRNRRLSCAAIYLNNNSKSIIDTAYDFCYETPEAFSKAFKKFHGISPKQINKKEYSYKSYPPLQLRIEFKALEPLTVSIENRPQFFMLGNGIRVPIDMKKNEELISDYWSDSFEDIKHLKYFDEFLNVAGVSISEKDRDDTFFYMICGLYNKEPKPSKGKVIIVPEHKWAVFRFKSIEANEIDNLWNRIYTEWLPFSGFELAELPEIEVYPYFNNPKDKSFEIWLPILSN